MPRRREVPKRDILPDPKFGSQDLTKFMNVVMIDGKKSVAERIIYGALEQIEKKTGKNAVEVFNTAISNAKPIVEVKSRRVGGANYQVPVEVSGFRATNLALRWIIRYADQRVGRSMSIKLANEIIDTANDIGNTIKKKEETHKMAEANKAFAHFRY